MEESKNKKHQDGAEESHVGPQKNAPWRLPTFPCTFLPDCWFWLVVGSRS